MITAKTLLLASLLGFGGASVTLLSAEHLAPSSPEQARVIVLPEIVVSAAVSEARVVTLPVVEIVVGGLNEAEQSGGVPGS